jgi:hypothetical protein
MRTLATPARPASLLFCLMLLGAPLPGFGQTRPAPPRAKADPLTETNLSVELLTGDEGVGERAHQWLKVFEGLNVRLKVRRATVGEKPEVTERKYGNSLREVRAVGTLERDGSISFPGKRFQQSDGTRLKEWLTELRTYGAQGSPAGQPLWGLTKTQFEPIFHALSTPLAAEPHGQDLGGALATFRLPKTYPLTLTAGAEKQISTLPPSLKVGDHLEGFSQGTALAIVLRTFGLGFHPRRTPEGTFEFAVVPLSESPETWPIGWPLAQEEHAVLPQLYKLVKIDLHEEPLTDVLEALPDFIHIPVFIDAYGLRVEKIDLTEAKVNLTQKQATWSSALKRLLFPSKLRREVWCDESGKPFLWITPLAAARRTPE